MTYFKATRPDGTDFHSGRIHYDKVGSTVKHPRSVVGSEDARDYISVSTLATDCTGFSWPARLFEVEPVGETWVPHKSELPNKVAASAVKIIRELAPADVFGPHSGDILGIIERFDALTSDERTQLYQARDDAFWAAYERVAYRDGHAVRAGLEAARGALGDRLRGWGGDGTSCGAALALLAQDVITKKDYQALTAPWRKVVGPLPTWRGR